MALFPMNPLGMSQNLTPPGPLYGGQQQQPRPKPFAGIGNIIAPLLMAVGADMVGGRGAGANVIPQYAQQAQERKRRNATLEWLKAQPGMESLYGAVEAGVMTPGDAYGHYLKQKTAQSDGPGVFGTPIYGTDKDGKTKVGVIGKDGTFRALDTGDFNVAGGIETIDAGTHWILRDRRTNTDLGTIPKENYQESFDKARGGAEGKGVGEAQISATSLESKLPGLMNVVDRLGQLSETATYTGAGRIYDAGRKELGLEPRQGALDRTEYIAVVDNQILPLLRDTFGAAFTVQEGESLRATLGDPNKTPEEKQRVLKAFIDQKVRDVEALKVQAGQTPQPGGGQRLRYNPQTGELE